MQVFQNYFSPSLMLLAAALVICPSQAEEAQPSRAHTITFDAKVMLGSKHDLTSLNHRAGLEAMEGVAYNDYDTPCIYCHPRPEKNVGDSESSGGITGWNRIRRGDAARGDHVPGA